MKVEFTAEEVNAMFDAVVDQVVELKLGRADTAAVRRWRPGRSSVSTTSRRSERRYRLS